jgi:hypothetical protein
VFAHAVKVESVRFAAFLAFSPVLPGMSIDNTSSGVIQLHECQCISSQRYGCVMVGCGIIESRACSWRRCPKGSRAVYCPPVFFASRLAAMDRCSGMPHQKLTSIDL